MKDDTSTASIFEALQTLQREVNQRSKEISLWCCRSSNTKADRIALVVLALQSSKTSETLMTRLWQAESELLTAKNELEHWHDKGHEPVRDQPRPLH